MPEAQYGQHRALLSYFNLSASLATSPSAPGWKWKLVTQSCLILCNPIGCSQPGSSVHGILQARILGWVSIPFSRGPPNPGIEPRSPVVLALTGRFFTIWATREAQVDQSHIPMMQIWPGPLYSIRTSSPPTESSSNSIRKMKVRDLTVLCAHPSYVILYTLVTTCRHSCPPPPPTSRLPECVILFFPCP